jgi:hypothetical protein
MEYQIMNTINAHEANPPKNPYLNDPDRPIYAICSLMQQLPATMPDAGALTRDQVQMAVALAHYADVTGDTALAGLAELGKLMHESESPCADSMPHLGRLIQHLSVEAQLMREIAATW